MELPAKNGGDDPRKRYASAVCLGWARTRRRVPGSSMQPAYAEATSAVSGQDLRYASSGRRSEHSLFLPQPEPISSVNTVSFNPGNAVWPYTAELPAGAGLFLLTDGPDSLVSMPPGFLLGPSRWLISRRHLQQLGGWTPRPTRVESHRIDRGLQLARQQTGRQGRF